MIKSCTVFILISFVAPLAQAFDVDTQNNSHLHNLRVRDTEPLFFNKPGTPRPSPPDRPPVVPDYAPPTITPPPNTDTPDIDTDTTQLPNDTPRVEPPPQVPAPEPGTSPHIPDDYVPGAEDGGLAGVDNDRENSTQAPGPDVAEEPPPADNTEVVDGGTAPITAPPAPERPTGLIAPPLEDDDAPPVNHDGHPSPIKSCGATAHEVVFKKYGSKLAGGDQPVTIGCDSHITMGPNLKQANKYIASNVFRAFLREHMLTCVNNALLGFDDIPRNVKADSTHLHVSSIYYHKRSGNGKMSMHGSGRSIDVHGLNIYLSNGDKREIKLTDRYKNTKPYKFFAACWRDKIKTAAEKACAPKKIYWSTKAGFKNGVIDANAVNRDGSRTHKTHLHMTLPFCNKTQMKINGKLETYNSF